ncbi:hypothetical protein DLAC_00148 [Tieghemostelium lacteum]|uniref:Uncharacterized protein n=1 Tax=Tieghemostelium lacteum TaxID=361077 RepID=A0A152A8Z0_TIELA|nr:hypothetical protein DLAC_00148 [Tieghemostelium lacteum]|eukprot:KYR02689.1 hypothetical protein DLAC_00148 [Tieghemostelium lacteum]
MTEPVYHYYWVDRCSNPHPWLFIGGYHTASRTGKSKLLKNTKSRKGHINSYVGIPRDLKPIDYYHGKECPKYYCNAMYENPGSQHAGFHERHYLLRNREHFVPVVFEKPYYIERVTLEDRVTRADLSDKNIQNAQILAKKMYNPNYKYYDEPLYIQEQHKDILRQEKVIEQQNRMAQKKLIEKEAVNRKISRDEQRLTNPPSSRIPYQPTPPMVIQEPMSGFVETFTTVPSSSSTFTSTTVSERVVTEPLYREERVMVPVETKFNDTVIYSDQNKTTTYMTDKDEKTPKYSTHPQMSSDGHLYKAGEPTFKEEVVMKKDGDSWVSNEFEKKKPTPTQSKKSRKGSKPLNAAI